MARFRTADRNRIQPLLDLVKENNAFLMYQTCILDLTKNENIDEEKAA